MGKEEKSYYQLTEKQRKDVKTALSALLEVCQIYNIPMFASVAVENGAEKTEYENIVYGGRAHEVYLKDDHIQRHILVANGGRVVPPRDVFELDMNAVLEDV